VGAPAAIAVTGSITASMSSASTTLKSFFIWY